MSKSADIFVVLVDGALLVRPATAIVPQGQGSVVFRNTTGFGVRVVFPAGLTEPGTLPLRPRSHDKIDLNPGDFAAFSYQVLVEELALAAQGNSSPIMIIDR